ncbi:DoxX family protein [Corallococcus praedator]|uniref:DoxX family protein n=1 Tax=Corallococcus praedator TaxID=2316724 RepID=A0ABX9QLD6_9BACT|nr:MULTISPECIES: DoxX family protein [Corallococcus]RKH18267.1 DoxX family protein [Corallococcus sp. CA047B]RKH32852.1 DoxX family protein [Corallococcus sp. CA031C]RKI11928.1 DoxX family protein [Corallococcus praedator]
MDTALSPASTPVEASQQKKKSLTRFLPTIARVLMGLVFFVFGLNGFLDFIPPPPNLDPADPAVAFGIAMKATGYLFWLVKGTEVVVGALLLTNRFVPLALALIAPVLVNIFMVHALLAPAGLGLAVVLMTLELFLAWSYRAVYRPMLGMRVAPGA